MYWTQVRQKFVNCQKLLDNHNGGERW